MDLEKEFRELNKRVTILELCVAIFFSISFTLIYAITKIQHIDFYWKNLIEYFIIFFSVPLYFIYILLPILKTIEKVGLGIKDIFVEFISKYKKSSKLEKTKTIIVMVLAIPGLVQVITWIYKIIEKNIK